MAPNALSSHSVEVSFDALNVLTTSTCNQNSIFLIHNIIKCKNCGTSGTSQKSMGSVIFNFLAFMYI